MRPRTRRLAPRFALGVATLFALMAAPALAETSFQTINLDGATSAVVNIEMNAGRIELGPAAAVAATPTLDAVLLDAEYDVTSAGWEGRADYSVTAGVGMLTVTQASLVDIDLEDAEQFGEGEFDATWRFALNPAIPTDLEIDLRAGEAEIKLAGLNLTSLDLDLDAGQIEVDLRGEWTESLTNAHVSTTGGRIVIKVPTDIGVRVDASTSFVGRVIVDDGFVKEDDAWVNAAYGQTDVTIDIEADATVGEIKLELGD